jgi:hypothetical protein
MATIKLYADKINQMPGLIKDVKLSVASYKTELAALQKKSLSIRTDICNMDDVISSIQASTRIQEEKLDSLETLSKNVEQFTDNVVRIDNEVADLIKQRKDEFFDKYSYLKPDYEKSWLEDFGDGFVSVAEWCKNNWKMALKIVAVVVLVAVSVVLLCTGVGGILAGAAWGAILGSVIGGVSGGVASAINGDSIFEGFVNGAFTGAIGGAIGGGITSGLTSFLGPASTFLRSVGQNMGIGAVSGGISNTSVTSISLLIDHGTLEGHGSQILASGISGALVGGIIGGASEGLINASSFKALSGKAKSADISTAPSEAVFYSGKSGLNAQSAKSFATENFKKTIEMTPGGRLFDKMSLFNSYKNGRVTPNQAGKIWSILSDNYSKQASGNIFEFVDGAASASIYRTVELPNINNSITSGRITNAFSELLKRKG